MKKRNPVSAGEKKRGRPRAFNREEALGKAIALFWKHGYDATSIATLKEALGIESPSLYAAFGSKENLFQECVQVYSARYLEEIAGNLFASVSARAGIERLLLQFAAHYAGSGHPKGCLIVSAATNCQPDAAPIEASLRHMRIAGVDLLRKRIALGVAAGEFAGRVDEGELAKFYSAVLLGMAMRARDGASLKELEATVRMSLAAWPR